MERLSGSSGTITVTAAVTAGTASSATSATPTTTTKTTTTTSSGETKQTIVRRAVLVVTVPPVNLFLTSDAPAAVTTPASAASATQNAAQTTFGTGTTLTSVTSPPLSVPMSGSDAVVGAVEGSEFWDWLFGIPAPEQSDEEDADAAADGAGAEADVALSGVAVGE